MRWDLLFHDLESQLEQQLLAEQADRRSEQLRFHRARLGLGERLGALVREALAAGTGGAGAARAAAPSSPRSAAAFRPARGAVDAARAQFDPDPAPGVLSVGLRNGRALRLVPVAVGLDWCAGTLQDSSGGRQAVLPFAAVAEYGCEGSLLEAAQAVDEREAEEVIADAAGGSLSSPGLRIGLGFMLRDLCRRRTPLRLELPGSQLHGTIDRVGRDHLDLALHPIGTLRRQRSVTGLRVVALESLLLVELDRL